MLTGLTLAAPTSGPAASESGERIELTCVARGNSHTARMSFDFLPRTCRLYWRELDRFLELEVCERPHIRALRPFAGKTDSHLAFNLETGAFVSRFGGVDDRGHCEAARVAK